MRQSRDCPAPGRSEFDSQTPDELELTPEEQARVDEGMARWRAAQDADVVELRPRDVADRT